jgi:hypothetical protein
MKKYKRTNNDLQNVYIKLKIEKHEPIQTWGVFLLVKLKSSLRKFNGHHYDLVDRYGISVSQTTTDMFHLS